MPILAEFCICMIVGCGVAALFGLLEAAVMALLDAD